MEFTLPAQHQHVRDAVREFCEGTSEIQRLVLGRELGL
jgi:alkylation response protein AidB-like acyl-CoA dehydrogenase